MSALVPSSRCDKKMKDLEEVNKELKEKLEVEKHVEVEEVQYESRLMNS